MHNDLRASLQGYNNNKIQQDRLPQAGETMHGYETNTLQLLRLLTPRQESPKACSLQNDPNGTMYIPMQRLIYLITGLALI